METKIINLTPHAINIVDCNGNGIMAIEPSGKLARVASKTVFTGISINWIPVTETEYSDVEGLPAPQDGVVYIVSAIVAQRVPQREDVFIVNQSVRDDNGKIIGCRSLAKV